MAGRSDIKAGGAYVELTLRNSAFLKGLRGALSHLASFAKGFAIAGTDGKFVWADAKIEKDTVIVSSKAVPSPMFVRYAFASNPQATLYNQEGLPALPFRTDRKK